MKKKRKSSEPLPASKSTLMDLPPPSKNPLMETGAQQVQSTESGRPPPGVVDLDLMHKTWQDNVRTQKELIRVVERNEESNALTRDDNAKTRGAAYLTSVLVLLSLGIGIYYGVKIIRQQKEAVTAAQSSDARLKTVQSQLKLVVDSITAAQEADAVEAEVEAEEAQRAPESKQWAVSAKRVKAVRQKKAVAHAKAIKAQIGVAPNKKAREAAESRLWQVEQKAKANGYDVGEF